MKITFIILFFLLIANECISQQLNSLPQIEDSINTHFAILLKQPSDSLKMNTNKKIIDLFETALNTSGSNIYEFKKIRNIANLKSSDGQIKIINWNIPFTDGTFKYFAFFQYTPAKGQPKVFKCEDKSSTILNPLTTMLPPENWYGALYYKLIETKYNNLTIYTLLGWDGNDNFTNKKLVETFFIENEKIVFGPPVFKLEKVTQNRLIFEYAEQAKMMLRFDEKINLIVWDHLSPSQPQFTGQYMYYGPDLSQDGLVFSEGNWILKPNLDMRNMQKSTGKSIKKSF